HNQRRLDQCIRGRVDLGNQQRRQTLSDFRKLDRSASSIARWAAKFGDLIRVSIGNKRVDCVNLDVFCKFEGNRSFGFDAERSGAPRRHHKPWLRGCAELLEGMKTRLVETIDRQREKELRTL